MDLMYFFKVLMKRKWLILLIMLLSVGVTYFLTGEQEDVYMAGAKLATGIVDNQDDDGKYMPPQKIETKFNNLIQNLNSKSVVTLLSYKLFLHDISNNEDAFRNPSALKDLYSSDEINNGIATVKMKQDSLAILLPGKEQDKQVIEMLKVLKYDYDALRLALKPQRLKDSDYIQVEFRSENPELSAFAANELCTEFIRYYKSDKSKRESSEIKLFNTQQEDKLKSLNERKEELNHFKLENNIHDLYAQKGAIYAQIKEFEMLREGEKSKIPSYQTTINNLNRDQEESEQSSLRKQEQNRKINNLRSEINYLNDKYINEGSKDKKLLSQIEKLKGELRAAIDEGSSSTNNNSGEIKTIKENSQVELQIAQTSVASIDQKIQSLKNELAVLVSFEPKIDDLESRIEQAEEAYKEVTAQLSIAQSEAIQSESSLKREEEASPPREPEPTKQIFYSLFSGMLSLSFCVVLFFVLEYIDVSIKSPAQFERFTNLRLLGYLNQINFISFNLDVNFIDLNLESIFHNKNQNPQLETFKQLIRKIRFEIESTDAKRFLFTSTREHEGKTFAMISLAYTLSLNNKKVLLIDTNFKNNTLTNMLSAKPSLEKHFNQSLVKEDIITKSKLKGIDVIGCYEGNYSPSEVFSQSNFHNLVNDLSQHYDFIFMEGAALNEYSDSKELISIVEKVISVFSTNSVIKDQDKSSIAYLRGLGDKFMGAILNKVDINNLN
ncbi:MAG: hypothetical protein SH857_00830 [Chitinophagales bacterium]|nr:hypothetical protein [Chitinophagales bacterium]